MSTVTDTPLWSDADDQMLGGDLTAALGYLTPAGVVVVTPVAPVGLRDRDAGTVHRSPDSAPRPTRRCCCCWSTA